jgi:NADH-quinone oxidoreductase subunit L
VLWLIGAVTSLLTATYMFRLVFLTFFGERRTAGHAHDAHAGHAGQGGHAGHGAPHEAPSSMAVPLIILAIGSVVAGYVGVPHALGGSNRIERFLEPSFEAHATTRAAEPVAAAAEPGTAPAPAHAQEAHAGDAVALERMLMALSSGIAVAGIGIAFFFWLRRPDSAAAIAERAGGLYRLLLNKYYVDEIYDAVIVQPIKQVSTNGLWRAIDVGVVDGAVNGVGLVVSAASGTLRRVQTGSIRVYAASLFFGVVCILGWYLWV